ncbi:ABC-2 family transporter protein [Paenibacillus alvei]|jgi:ABC-2 type transport system permease protein|uniref:ABC-2 family transporter protein n=1 Tax=Paenibacillus alvei TaxID=44250 RepID=A0AAP7DKH2_PAEAL|nr:MULTISPECIES: ABC-2 family transporter protein [Paenibacillus]EJW19483.1 ABC-type putative transport system, permease component [Paenibacillus alvei DSM 29]MCY7485686.1 ABC-2 family transporter protein [Paenibacillus alvei]MCY9541311.1 ABC-2 family transporter protein [Paenibacillus alvei]MCY9702785.1 ABC-2 family transporter protein [Paenibacillus alvei]MCY9734234.1 ABC-2 family transporter protein [Paenibacillus alvei]
MASAYLEFIRIRFLLMLAYRVNYYSGILIYTLNIGVYYFTWQAIYGGQGTLAGFTADQMTTYIAVSWMARAFYFNNMDRDIAMEIRDGSVAIQFIRPYNYLFVKLMQAFGEGLFRLLLFMGPGMVIACILFPVKLPQDPKQWAVFGVMLFMSFLINSQLNMLTGLTAFFIENNEGMIRMKRVVVDLFSGVIVPISFFPGWLLALNEWLPFQAITYLPSSVFTGRVAGDQVWAALGIQLLWAVVLVIPIVLLWRSARRRLFVQGG